MVVCVTSIVLVADKNHVNILEDVHHVSKNDQLCDVQYYLQFLQYPRAFSVLTL